MIFYTLKTIITDDDWITSDAHFGHANIMKYCDRPFCCKHQMDSVMIAKWNNVVGFNDRVFFLGDFAWGSNGYRKRILERLNGHIFFFRGNHDKERQWMVDAGCHLGCLDAEAVYRPSDGPEKTVYMRHLPNWKRAPDFDYHICGHVHNTWTRVRNVINASADMWDYAPARFADLIAAPEDPPSILEPKDPEFKEKMAIKNTQLKIRLYGKDD